ncbi:MAG: thioether cross-link-forming SCIFF peptide maturase [Oscillospiraceae bacterium]|jgi:uncharacterized protein|nr:thioether cross-link-forming SCIFF peptide maturase [Oscillospiraceae bacterium]
MSIYAYTLFDKNIVLDIGSGSVHVVDPVAYAAITQWAQTPEKAALRTALQAQFPQEPPEEFDLLLEEINVLVQRGKLFAPEAAAGLDYATLAAQKRATRPDSVKALCLHVAHTCNLACEYCFAKAGNYNGAAALMPFSVGKRALDFLIEQSGAHKNLEVDFFGGEPLMNWPVVKQLVAYARSLEAAHNKRFRFTLTTNGVLLDDEVTAFCNREMENVVLSLDGRKEIHDRLRRFPGQGGGGSYDLVVPKFQRFAAARAAAGKSYYMRGTFTHANPDFCADVLHMAALGFHALSMEPVVCAADSPHALTQDDLRTVMAAYEQLAREMAKRAGAPEAFTFYHYTLDLQHGPCLYKRVTGCGSGTQYLAVTPEGALYPCHQFVGEARFCMGDVWQGVTNHALRAEFGECDLYSRPECRECWARLYCSGGCAANAYHACGNINGIYPTGCELFRKRMECAIWLASEGGG